MNNHDIATLLRQVATAYSLQGFNRFRTIAYERAADTIEHMDQELEDVYENGMDLAELPGIGSSLAGHLKELFLHPDDNYLLTQRAGIPETVYVLLDIPRIGPKNAMKLVTTFQLNDPKTVVDDLQKLAKEGKIAPLDGFGDKSQSEILNSIEVYHKRKDQPKRTYLPIAYKAAMEVVEYMKQHPKVKKLDVLGSLRRWEATIGDVDIAAVCDDGDAGEVIAYFVDFPKKIRVEGKGPKKGSIIVSGGLRIDFETVSEEQYGAMLQYFTGNKDHNIKLREYALKKGYSISEYGIKVASDKIQEARNPTSQRLRGASKIQNGKNSGITLKDNLIQFSEEELLYNFLGLDYIPPELRQGRDEISLAEKHKLPKLVELNDIRGDIHIHTSFNIEPSHDLGADEPLTIVNRAKELGYTFVGFSDHNPAIKGHSDGDIIDILRRRKEYIEKQLTNKIERSNYFISMETDIQPDGNLALPPGALEYLDCMLVSIHSSFLQTRIEMTERILKGLSFPKVKVMAHPTARLIGKREEIDANWKQIFQYAADRGIAMEINASPERLDLPEYLIREAKSCGCKFLLGTDSHAVGHLDGMYYGVAMARRAGLEKGDIINCWSIEKVRDFLISK